MISWPSPSIPAVPGTGPVLRLYDTSARAVRPVEVTGEAGLYVCGITPYDATHLGHAATYVTFDLVGRALRDAGHQVRYVQNVTDVDDPLLARAVRDGHDWRDLASRETALFREDMTALGVIAPDHYIGVVESVPRIVDVVAALVAGGAAYGLAVPGDEGTGHDVYLDLTAAPAFGEVGHLSRDDMLELFAQRGGDPGRSGKRDPLDPLLWRAEREGEPAWEGGSLGFGRPGWHIECTTIALDYLGMGFTIQGGGSDLVFPHHEMSAVQAEAVTGERTFASSYVHQAMVGLDGEKMSKSKGNLVLVSELRRQGVDPMAIRLALLGRHYRTEWSWTDPLLVEAQHRLDTWRAALSVNAGPAAEAMVAMVRERLGDDLDGAGALAAVDAWAASCLTDGGDDPGAPGLAARTVDALLGVRL
ncbi:MAG TPA: cysteine--1-D-myo-inosityl 2-amino-2-deoxy-alpha-D-glucopyranoside ligase [Candidatus Lustribacter sp.]|nr:cysteine--1-D-myo-inosityl 2-amino-2-deoxy-alpha-D-glucopyranoside ligase [Candidatus Lustribacter sp.]